MLKKPGQVGKWKSSPSVSTPRTVRNIEIGEPRAKKFSGENLSCGYCTKGIPVPETPIIKLTDVCEAERNNGSLKSHK